VTLLNPSTGETTLDGTEATIVYTVESLTWIEANLPGRSVMEILEHGRRARWKISELQVVVWAGMEAHRRRTGAGGSQVNPAKALGVIEDGGGLHPVAMQVMDALMRSTALGLNPDRDRRGDDAAAVPTMADGSSSASPPPAFHPPPPGS
jgi:hypothetical protein